MLTDDLRALRSRSLCVPSLWDHFREDFTENNPESRAYRAVGDLVLRELTELGFRSRHHTHLRMASALVAEIAAAPLGASGIARMYTDGLRASMCDCNRRDFKNRLAGMYQGLFERLAREVCSADLIPCSSPGKSESVEKTEAKKCA